MADPTPEERAIAIAVDAERIYMTGSGIEPEGYDAALAEYACDEIRAAVAAQKERDAREANPFGVKCPYCYRQPDSACHEMNVPILTYHNARWRAAIREGSEDADTEIDG
jgi:hypothetical protein